MDGDALFQRMLEQDDAVLERIEESVRARWRLPAGDYGWLGEQVVNLHDFVIAIQTTLEQHGRWPPDIHVPEPPAALRAIETAIPKILGRPPDPAVTEATRLDALAPRWRRRHFLERLCREVGAEPSLYLKTPLGCGWRCGIPLVCALAVAGASHWAAGWGWTGALSAGLGAGVLAMAALVECLDRLFVASRHATVGDMANAMAWEKRDRDNYERLTREVEDLIREQLAG